MAQHYSRRRVVEALLDELAQDTAHQDRIVQSFAAYLIETGQAKQVDLYIADIKKSLLRRGIAYAEIVTAHKASDDTLRMLSKQIKDATHAKTVEYDTRVDPSVVGGVRLTLPGSELDATVRRQLQQLQQ